MHHRGAIMRSVLSAFMAVILAGAAVGPGAVAQDGPYYEYWVGGVPLSCVANNRRIPIYLDNRLSDLAIARIEGNGFAYIVLNDQGMRSAEPIVQAFVFAHECGHHLGPFLGESWADCWAVRELRVMGFIQTQGQVASIMRAFSNSAGSQFGHLPGPARAELIRRCAMQ